VVKQLEHGRKKIQPNTRALLSAWRQIFGETRQVRFNDILTAYNKDPSCKAFVDFLADHAVANGFHTTVNEQYAKAKKTKQIVDNFNETVNLDELLQIASREIVETKVMALQQFIKRTCEWRNFHSFNTASRFDRKKSKLQTKLGHRKTRSQT